MRKAYSESFKQRTIQRLLGPGSVSAKRAVEGGSSDAVYAVAVAEGGR